MVYPQSAMAKNTCVQKTALCLGILQCLLLIGSTVWATFFYNGLNDENKFWRSIGLWSTVVSTSARRRVEFHAEQVREPLGSLEIVLKRITRVISQLSLKSGIDELSIGAHMVHSWSQMNSLSVHSRDLISAGLSVRIISYSEIDDSK